MSIVIGFFTFLLVLDCLVLILLVLIQLPKKEAGMGLAFGGGATDALFGAGSGTALTKMTKYTAAIFFALTMLISVLHARQSRSSGEDLRNILSAEEKLSLVSPAARTNAPAASVSATNTNAIVLTATNAPTANAK